MPSDSRPRPRRVGLLAGLIAVTLAGGVARVATADGRDGPATTAGVGDPARRPPSASAVPLSAGAVQPATGAAEPLSSAPAPQATPAVDARDDLMARLPTLDPSQAEPRPEQARGFEDPDAFVAALPASDQARQRELLTGEGFQGAYDELFQSAATRRVYRVQLSRFAAAAGALTHLRGFDHGPAGSQGRLTPVASSAPESLQFQGKTAVGDFHEALAYTAEGRYFAEILVVDPLTGGNPTADSVDEGQLLDSVRQALS